MATPRTAPASSIAPVTGQMISTALARRPRTTLKTFAIPAYRLPHNGPALVGRLVQVCELGAPDYRVIARMTASLAPAALSLIIVSGVRSNFDGEFLIVVMIISSAIFAAIICMIWSIVNCWPCF